MTNSDLMRVSPQASTIYLIETGWGQVGRGMIEKHRKLLQQNILQNPSNPSAEAVLGESLAMIGYTWLAELSQEQQIVDQLAGTITRYHHASGIVGMRAVGSSVGPYVDLPINGFGVTQRSGRPTSSGLTPIESAAFFSEATFSSIAESGVLEQTQPGATAVSTVKLVDTVLQSSGHIFDINNSAVSGDDCAYYAGSGGFRSQLSGYGSADLARIDSLVGYVPGTGCKSLSDPTNPNLRVIAPANGAITVGLFTGAGYFEVAQDGAAIGSIITGGLSGGLPASAVPIPELAANTPASVVPALPQSAVITNPQGSQGNTGANLGATPASSEPINLVTGDYNLSATDLTVGSRGMPYGLAFQRYYDSGTRLRGGPLGFGWTHNFAITALADSDPFEGMGINSPINGAAAIAATFVAQDILNAGSGTAKPLDRVVIASVVQRWLMEQLTTNIVAVTQPGYVEHFTRLADGNYNPPPGSAATLTLGGGAYTYLTKNGVRLSFNSAGNLASWSNPAGVTLTLSYSGTPAVLNSVANNLGRTLSFAYSYGHLTQVSDGIGRSVSDSCDGSGNLVGCTDALGNVTTYAYDAPGRLTQIFHPAAVSAAASSTAPRSAPPETRLGRICSTAGARPFGGTGAVLSSTLILLLAATPSMSTPDKLTRRDGATIAYHRLAGSCPGIVFLGGFRSDMTGTKALFLEDYCRRRGQAFVRFDYFGHGASSGDIASGTIGRWVEDAVAALDSLTDGPQILVGSSMGGWIMLRAALARPSRVHALIGIAAAPDFTEDLVWPRLDPAQRRELRETGAVTLPSEYDPAGYTYRLNLFEDGKRHLVMRKPIALTCPVRLDKQKEGKRRMRQFGKVEIPQSAFIAALKMGDG